MTNNEVVVLREFLHGSAGQKFIEDLRDSAPDIIKEGPMPTVEAIAILGARRQGYEDCLTMIKSFAELHGQKTTKVTIGE